MYMCIYQDFLQLHVRENNFRGISNTCYVDKSNSLNVHAMTQVNVASNGLDTPVRSTKVERQIRALTDPPSKQPKLLYDLVKDLPHGVLRRSGETSCSTEGSSCAPGNMSDLIFQS